MVGGKMTNVKSIRLAVFCFSLVLYGGSAVGEPIGNGSSAPSACDTCAACPKGPAETLKDETQNQQKGADCSAACNTCYLQGIVEKPTTIDPTTIDSAAKGKARGAE
jgi:hypothetical protein